MHNAYTSELLLALTKRANGNNNVQGHYDAMNNMGGMHGADIFNQKNE